MRHKDPSIFQWDIYFLSHNTHNQSKRGNINNTINKESEYYDLLKNKITDKKFFHRKGVCILKAERGEEFKDFTLILTGDQLYYVNESVDDSLNLIPLAEASLHDSKERTYAFEIRSGRRKFEIAFKSQHDRDNWVSAILSQIDHTK